MSALPVQDAPWIARQRTLLLAQRGHAYLLHGPSGLGQYPLALSLARAWLCEQPTAHAACGHCPSCHAIDVRTHADLHVLMPEVQQLALGWPLDEKSQSELDEKKRKPSKDIRVEAMRSATEFSQRTSARGRGKVVLVYPAERMNAVSANALLKTLEEPPGDVRFVLATEAAHFLLPTIRSRCLGHAMTWPEIAESVQWLMNTHAVDEPQARALLQVAGQRPEDAARLIELGRDPKTWHGLARALREGDASVFKDWSALDVIEALQKLAHDVWVVQLGAAPRFFEAQTLPKGLDAAAVAAWSRSLAESRRVAEHPFNPGLMLEALVSQAQQVLSARAPSPN